MNTFINCKCINCYNLSEKKKLPFAVSSSVLSESLRPHGLQHVRLPFPSPSPGACSHSCRSGWLMPSSHFVLCCPFSSGPQSFPASGPFPMSQFFASGGQNIGASDSASVLPMNIQDWLPLGLTGLISFQLKGLSRVFSTPQFKSINSSMFSLGYGSASHPYMTTGKTIALTIWTLVSRIISAF